jgi:hypothetical protein
MDAEDELSVMEDADVDFDVMNDTTSGTTWESSFAYTSNPSLANAAAVVIQAHWRGVMGRHAFDLYLADMLEEHDTAQRMDSIMEEEDMEYEFDDAVTSHFDDDDLSLHLQNWSGVHLDGAEGIGGVEEHKVATAAGERHEESVHSDFEIEHYSTDTEASSDGDSEGREQHDENDEDIHDDHWEERVEPTTQLKYLYNRKRRESRWKHELDISQLHG